jgi:hypothetical protein
MSRVNKTTKYGDRVFTMTEFTRRPGEVLDTARNVPVTISRKSDQFAIIERREATALYKAVEHFKQVIEVIGAAAQVGFGDEVQRSLRWVKSLGTADLKAMCEELTTAVKHAESDPDLWDRIPSIIHEWRESAAVIQSGVLRDAMKEPMDEQLIAEPSDEE